MKKITNPELGRPTIEQYNKMAKMPVTVVLDNVRSLNNVGSFFRTCDAFAVERIFLCGITGTPPNKELHKTALGAEESVAWEYKKNTACALAELRDEGYRTVAIEQVYGASMLEAYMPPVDTKFALVFGNEVFGVSEEALELCNEAIEIPQTGTKHSLNVAVSGGVVLWHFFDHYRRLGVI